MLGSYLRKRKLSLGAQKYTSSLQVRLNRRWTATGPDCWGEVVYIKHLPYFPLRTHDNWRLQTVLPRAKRLDFTCNMQLLHTKQMSEPSYHLCSTQLGISLSLQHLQDHFFSSKNKLRKSAFLLNLVPLHFLSHWSNSAIFHSHILSASWITLQKQNLIPSDPYFLDTHGYQA